LKVMILKRLNINMFIKLKFNNFSALLVLLLFLPLFSCDKFQTKKADDINYVNLEELKDDFGRCSFKVPKEVFKKVESNLFVSAKLNSKIEFSSNWYSPYDLDFISSKEELLEKCSKNIQVISSNSDDNSIEVIGKDSKNYFFIKGYFNLIDALDDTEKYNIHGFQTGILKMEMPLENKFEFEQIHRVLNNSFVCDFGEF
jgi:hypothetical protein